MSDFHQKGEDEIFCSSCGTAIKRDAAVCSICGVKQAKQAVSNVLVWILAFVPAIGAAFEFGTLVFLAANIILCIVDEKKLQKLGYETASLGSAWFIPVYLYKRAKMLNQSPAYFIVWCVCFGISFFGFF